MAPSRRLTKSYKHPYYEIVQLIKSWLNYNSGGTWVTGLIRSELLDSLDSPYYYSLVDWYPYFHQSINTSCSIVILTIPFLTLLFGLRSKRFSLLIEIVLFLKNQTRRWFFYPPTHPPRIGWRRYIREDSGRLVDVEICCHQWNCTC